MKMPISFGFFFPLTILFIVSTNDWLLWLAGIIFITSVFLIEIRLRTGNLSLSSIKKFFNTPIKPPISIGEEVVDTSKNFSIFKGVTIIIGGTVLVWIALFFLFPLWEKTKSIDLEKNWHLYGKIIFLGIAFSVIIPQIFFRNKK